MTTYWCSVTHVKIVFTKDAMAQLYKIRYRQVIGIAIIVRFLDIINPLKLIVLCVQGEVV